MTTKWSEINPTTKLRDVVLREGVYFGTVKESFLPEQYKVDEFYAFRSFTVHDYNDHFFIVTGNTSDNKKYHYVKKENNERLEP